MDAWATEALFAKFWRAGAEEFVGSELKKMKEG
ncbi:uncharacterized protein G2W53_022500 [Senna tora]|uniref:Uncharacterized protein n=1 Tax=Senna tora TaxID=362788 RepID=A0A834TNT5_9FABA|nr:uncharacterized protein G2W53_022500 [Senna tora]